MCLNSCLSCIPFGANPIFRLKASLAQDVLLNKEVLDAKATQHLAAKVGEFRQLSEHVVSLAIIAAIRIDTLRPFCCGEQISDHLSRVRGFEYGRLGDWAEADLVLRFSNTLQPIVEDFHQSSSLEAFASVKALVGLCVSGSHGTWKCCDAQAMVERLPVVAGDTVGDIIVAFAQVDPSPLSRQRYVGAT